MYQWPVPHDSEPVEPHNICSHESPLVFYLASPKAICFGEFSFLNIPPLKTSE